ncbi:MAG: histone deacetylase [Desulfobacterales bacterium]|jgi:acetoin utilization deacetylase AcuC-like enzyme
MILHDERNNLGLADFGILIPVTDTRASKTFDALRAHPRLKGTVARWHRRPAGEILTEADLLRVHTPAYVARLFSDSDALEKELSRTYELVDGSGRYNRYDPASATLPLKKLFDRILRRAAGTVQCARIALETEFCFYFGGGMHHALADRGSGFCPINDIVIAIRKLQSEGKIDSAWVIDTDAHKGDGTAALTAGDDSIRTLSIHMAHGWPLDGNSTDANGRLRPSFVPSDIDIPVASGQENRYIDRLLEGLERLRRFPAPDLALVVYGADPYEKDALASTRELNLTLAQMKARDLAVYRFLQQQGIPMAYLMAGGYGPDAWEVYVQFLEEVLPERYGSG